MLNYQYIEQLLDRYFNCETTLEEEKILRTFFCQDNLPEHLKKYQPLFLYEQQEVKEDCLGEDFYARILSICGDETANERLTLANDRLNQANGRQNLSNGSRKPAKFSITRSFSVFMPFVKAAAAVALIVTIGNATQVLFEDRAETSTSVATIKTTSGENVADVQQKTDSLRIETEQQ